MLKKQVDKLKIKFFVPTVWAGANYLPTIQYMMKMSCDLTCKNAKSLEWCQSYFDDQDDNRIWNAFLEDKPDIVCLSVYLWSSEILHYLARRIKDEYPETVVILGGPDIEWKTYEKYLQKYDYYDYMIYGDAEDAFPKLIDQLIDNHFQPRTIDLMNIPNLMFLDHNKKPIKTKHEVYRNYIYKDYSPWLHCETEFRRDADTVISWSKQPAVAWETDRGCPYDCSFCDWQAGLHHKVIKKTYSAKDEIYLFAEKGCYISFNNANFGMFDEDAENIGLIWTLIASEKYPGLSAAEPSWAKMHKTRVHKIYVMYGEIFGKILIKPSLQSITEEVLENIERPSIPWPEYKKMVIDLKQHEHLPSEFYAELMVGLPGETRESWDAMLDEFIDLSPIKMLSTSVWHVLSNSPGSSPEYQEKHKMLILPSVAPMEDASERLNSSFLHRDKRIDFNQLSDDDIVQKMLNSTVEDAISYRANMVWSTYSSDVEDLLYMQWAAGIVVDLQRLSGGDTTATRKMFKQLKPMINERAAKDGEKFRHFYNKYGVMPHYMVYNGKLYNYNGGCMAEALTLLKKAR